MSALDAPQQRATHELSAFLFERVELVRRLHMTSALRACPHLASGTADLAITWASAPWVVACPACVDGAPELDVTARGACDRCALKAPGEIRALAVVPGRVAVLFGLCPGCFRKEFP